MMKKNKNIDYYRCLLHKDTVFLLFIAIFFGISSFLLQGFDIFLKSILFIFFLVISIFNKKEKGIFIGRFNVFIGVLMVLVSIRGSSLFDIAYLLLGIIYIIHSIIYLLKLKNTTLNLKKQNKNSKVIYLNLILVIISMICFKLVLSFRYSYFGLVFILLGVSLTLFIFISSLILIFKKYKSLLMYIIFVLSIFIVFAYLIIAVRVIPAYKLFSHAVFRPAHHVVHISGGKTHLFRKVEHPAKAFNRSCFCGTIKGNSFLK